jgi:hypothetical protein
MKRFLVNEPLFNLFDISLNSLFSVIACHRHDHHKNRQPESRRDKTAKELPLQK